MRNEKNATKILHGPHKPEKTQLLKSTKRQTEDRGSNCVAYWVTQKLPKICTIILRFRIGKVAGFAVIFAVTSESPSIIKLEEAMRKNQNFIIHLQTK